MCGFVAESKEGRGGVGDGGSSTVIGRRAHGTTNLGCRFPQERKQGNEEMEVSDHLRIGDGNQVWDLKEHVRPEGAKEGKRSNIGEQGSKMRNRLQGSKMRNQSSCTSSEWGPVLHDTLPESHMCVATMTSF